LQACLGERAQIVTTKLRTSRPRALSGGPGQLGFPKE
jgi:hypothetical protein